MLGADPYAEQLFQKNCASCHQAAAGAEARVPQIAALKTMTPAAILRTLESGIMKSQAAPLSGDERQKVANFLGTAVTVERRREEWLCDARRGCEPHRDECRLHLCALWLTHR